MPAPKILTSATFLLALLAVPVAAFGQGTEEQQQACTPDAVKLCSDAIPDIPKTTACMKAHFSQLSPRCQSAFNDATGGKSKAGPKAEPKTRAASRKVEPSSRAERRLPERGVEPRAEREARRPIEPGDRQAALPPSVGAVPPGSTGYPPYPSPDAPLVVAPRTYAPDLARGQIVQACRDGLIDSYTCSTTVPALLGRLAN